MSGAVDLSRFARPAAKYITDPPSLKSTRAPTLGRPILDVARIQDALARGLIDGIPELPDPNDEKLIATVVAHGMPRWSAEQMRYHPGLRLCYLRFFWDVADAAAGNKEAQDKVDAARFAWSEARKIELISDNPEHTIGLWER